MPLLELESLTAARERAELLQGALDVLTERQRVIVLCRQSRTVRQIAEDLECSYVKVHDDYQAALVRMREYLNARGVIELTEIF
jgi:DNA-directed RNA polymerase specialized sigma24 family protein